MSVPFDVWTSPGSEPEPGLRAPRDADPSFGGSKVVERDGSLGLGIRPVWFPSAVESARGTNRPFF